MTKILAFLSALLFSTAVCSQSWQTNAGTPTPSSALHVGGSRISIINPDEARLHLWNEAPVTEWILGQKSATSHKYTVSTSVAGTETGVFTITPDGKVGIVIIGSTARFTVHSAQEEISRFQHISSTNSRIVVANTTGAINLGVGNTNPNGYLWSSTDDIFIGTDGSTPTMFLKGMNGGRGDRYYGIG